MALGGTRLHSVIRTFWNWSVERGYAEVSPLFGMRPPAKSYARERVLTDDEVVAIWHGATGWVGATER